MTQALDPDLVDPAVRLLGTAIAMIMEDHVDPALTANTADGRLDDFAGELEQAGRAIIILAAAMRVLLDRRTRH